MARDIASVVEKNTREAEELPGEAAPFADAPRSEGGPATREPASPGPDERAFAPEADAPVVPTQADAPEEPEVSPLIERASAEPVPDAPTPDFTSAYPDFEPGADMADASLPVQVPEPPLEAELISPVESMAPSIDELPSDAPESEPAPEPAPEPLHELESEPPLQDGADALTDASQGEPWRGAIAEALAEPPVVTPDEAPAIEESFSPSLDTSAFEPPADPILEPEPAFESPEPTPTPPRLEPTDSIVPRSEPDIPETASVDDAHDAAFATVARDLFHPPDVREEPHLVTLGRRLDPALRIPRLDDVSDVAPPSKPAVRGGKPWKDYLRNGVRYALYAVAGYFALVLVLIVLFRFVNPPGSMLMLTQFIGGTSIDRTWVPLSAISPHLVRAVIVSEDGRFCEHSGVDTAAIREAIERAAKGTPRGASTISMQVTKNLFLWNSKSYLRKVIEIPLTLLMEVVWPKSRVLEVYLNIAEWAPGVFGAEAAARHHFKTSAALLNARQSALLAAVLPNPVERNASAPGRLTSAKARVVQARVRAYGAVASCALSSAADEPRRASAVPAMVRTPAARKAPAQQRPAAPRNQQPSSQATQPPPPKKSDDWSPMINFGPR